MSGLESSLRIGAEELRDPEAWRRCCVKALNSGQELRVIFPGHQPQVLEAATGAYGRFDVVAAELARLLGESARVVLEHPVTLA